ncbi:hypothetical protein Pan3_28 [Pseudanabaena phage Pan3]|nr:hypothetical protein Pan3_28 [Pseudanabaena phage Pan3]
METSDELTVTQEDREAAAPLMRHYYANQDGSFVAKLFERDVLSGKYDDHFVVQAFARHRIAQTKADAARIAELEAEVERLHQSNKALLAEKHKEQAEAKLWFERAQEWKAAAAALRAKEASNG